MLRVGQRGEIVLARRADEQAAPEADDGDADRQHAQRCGDRHLPQQGADDRAEHHGAKPEHRRAESGGEAAAVGEPALEAEEPGVERKAHADAAERAVSQVKQNRLRSLREEGGAQQPGAEQRDAEQADALRAEADIQRASGEAAGAEAEDHKAAHQIRRGERPVEIRHRVRAEHAPEIDHADTELAQQTADHRRERDFLLLHTDHLR